MYLERILFARRYRPSIYAASHMRNVSGNRPPFLPAGSNAGTCSSRISESTESFTETVRPCIARQELLRISVSRVGGIYFAFGSGEKNSRTPQARNSRRAERFAGRDYTWRGTCTDRFASERNSKGRFPLACDSSRGRRSRPRGLVNDSKLESSRGRPEARANCSGALLYLSGKTIFVPPSSRCFVRPLLTRHVYGRSRETRPVHASIAPAHGIGHENRFVSGYSPSNTFE